MQGVFKMVWTVWISGLVRRIELFFLEIFPYKYLILTKEAQLPKYPYLVKNLDAFNANAQYIKSFDFSHTNNSTVVLYRVCNRKTKYMAPHCAFADFLIHCPHKILVNTWKRSDTFHTTEKSTCVAIVLTQVSYYKMIT